MLLQKMEAINEIEELNIQFSVDKKAKVKEGCCEGGFPSRKQKPPIPVIVLINARNIESRTAPQNEHNFLRHFRKIYESQGWITVQCTPVCDRITNGQVAEVASTLLICLEKRELHKHPLILHVISHESIAIYNAICQAVRDEQEINGHFYQIKGCILDSCPLQSHGLMDKLREQLPHLYEFIMLLVWFIRTIFPEFFQDDDDSNSFNDFCYDSGMWPQLFLYSTTDHIVPHTDVEKVLNIRRGVGVSVEAKCWDDSEHVRHLFVHNKEVALKPKRGMLVAARKVRTLYHTGKSGQVVKELDNYRLDFWGESGRHNGKMLTRKNYRMRMKRVVGGNQYAEGDYPFHVSLQYMGSNNVFTEKTPDMHHTCGGSLIKPSWVLTSAGCFDDKVIMGLSDVSKWVVVVGMYGQKDSVDEDQKREIDSIFLAPTYSRRNAYGDLALLKLSSPVNLADGEFGVPNYDGKCPENGQSCTVIGWGQLAEAPYGFGSEYPKEASVDIIDTDACADVYSQPDVQTILGSIRVDGGNVCAGKMPQGGVDACYGDSGSPLLCRCNSEEELRIVATVSTGLGCAKPNIPAIYTRVSHYQDWIVKTIEE